VPKNSKIIIKNMIKNMVIRKTSARALTSFLCLVSLCLGIFTINESKASALSTIQTYSVSMPEKYYPQGQNGGSDDYRCFLLDPKVKENSILTSIQFVPFNRVLIHHAILFRLPANQVAAAKALDQNGQGWPCFGGSGIGTMFQSFITTPWLSAWVPGRDKDVAPAGYGYPFNKNDEIVVQIHYSLLYKSMAVFSFDQSKVKFNAVPAVKTKLKMLGYDLLPAPVEIPCLPGQVGSLCNRANSLRDLAARTSPQSAFEVTGIAVLCHQSPFNPKPSDSSTCDKTITKPETVVAVAPHMHLLGKSLQIIVNPGTSKEKILLNNQNYIFDDQASTFLKKPVVLQPGDVVRVNCSFDPKRRSELPALRNFPPKYITWGEGSTDEMCLGVMITSLNA
jgi:Copper type II ascorbate-dependent monooxygenase, C-terminal domain